MFSNLVTEEQRRTRCSTVQEEGGRNVAFAGVQREGVSQQHPELTVLPFTRMMVEQGEGTLLLHC
jgi:hypothetical protein